MRPFFKWLEVVPTLDESQARYENDNPDAFLLDEVKIDYKRKTPSFVVDPIVLSDPNAPGRIVYKPIPGASVMYNKDHIDGKVSTRFPTDSDVAKFAMNDKVSNYNEHIMFIFDRIYNRHASDINNDITVWKTKLGMPISEIKAYPQNLDAYFKYAIYTTVKHVDQDNIVHYYQIEAALAITLTLLTLDQIPLASIPWDQWYKNIPGNKVGAADNNAAVDIINILNQYNRVRGYDLIPLKIFDPDRVRFIPRLDVVSEPILYIAGYVTWVKEVDSDGNIIFGNFSKECGTPPEDIYCEHNQKTAKIYRDVFKDFGDNNEIDDQTFEKLKAFETQRKKNDKSDNQEEE